MELTPKPKIVLTIAGFDPSNGAGITADLQVFAAHGLFGTACITALTVQSTRGVAAVQPVCELIGQTLDHLSADLPPAGIKIGMLGSGEAVVAVAQFLRSRNGAGIPVVLDPVMLSSSGASLLDAAGLIALKRELLPLVSWVTPNREELAALAPAPSLEGSMYALQAQFPHLHIVATGGDADEQVAIDKLLLPSGELHTFSGERFQSTSTHGTGCAFSSALLARLVLGYAPQDGVAAAKAYVGEAIRSAPGVGHGRGPLQLLPQNAAARLEEHAADPQHTAQRTAAQR